MPGLHRIAVLALEGVAPFELGMPSRVFGNAHAEDGSALYEVTVCTADGLPVASDAGFTIGVTAYPEALAAADTVIVPPTHAMPGLLRGEPLPCGPRRRTRRHPARHPDRVHLLRLRGARRRRAARRAARHHALGARAGVPAGLPARPPRRGRALRRRRRHPHLGGRRGHIDLCLYLIRADHGTAAANRAARLCVVPPWRDGGQAQYIDRPVPEPTVATTTATRAWALERLAEPVTLAELAAHARMSLRTFTRRFRDEVGMTPVQWLTVQRLEVARQLLESSDLPVDLVAYRALLRLRQLAAPAHADRPRHLADRLPPDLPARHPGGRGGMTPEVMAFGSPAWQDRINSPIRKAT